VSDRKRVLCPRGQALRKRAAKLGLAASKLAGGGDLWRLTRRENGRAVPVVAGPIARCEAYLAEQAALPGVA
jgi:hypothetical protein